MHGDMQNAADLDPGPGTPSRLCQYAALSLWGQRSAASRACALSRGPARPSESVRLRLRASLRPLQGRLGSACAGARRARMLTGALHQDCSARECFSPTAAWVTRFTPSTLQVAGHC